MEVVERTAYNDNKSDQLTDTFKRLLKTHSFKVGVCRLGVIASSPAWTCVNCNSSVPTVSSVRDLGVHINSDVSLSTHVTATELYTCFAVLRHIRSVRRSLTRDAL